MSVTGTSVLISATADQFAPSFDVSNSIRDGIHIHGDADLQKAAADLVDRRFTLQIDHRLNGLP